MRHMLRTAVFSLTMILMTAMPPALAQDGMLSASGGKGQLTEITGAAPAVQPPLQSPARLEAAPAPTPTPTPAPATATASTSAPTSTSTGGSLSADNPAYVIPGMPTKQEEKNDDDRDPLKDPIFLSLPQNLQDQIMDESHQYNRDCKVLSSYATFHNCDCIALHYMNERLHHPDMTRGDIRDKIRLDCVDAPSIANYSYNSCLQLFAPLFPKILTPLCECYARDYALAYAAKPNVSSQYQAQLGVEIISKCRTKLTNMTPDAQAGTSTLPADSP
jgi:hypothetical protein